MMLRRIGVIVALVLSTSTVAAQQPGAPTPDRHPGMASRDQVTMMTQFCEPNELGACIVQFGSSVQCPSTM